MIAAVVACSRTKREHAAPAGELYLGTLHRLARRAADRLVIDGRAATVMILSARYGLVPLSQVLAPYDTRMSDTEAVSFWRVQGQAAMAGLDGVIALTPADYTRCLVLAVGADHVECPLSGARGIGIMRARLAAIARGEYATS